MIIMQWISLSLARATQMLDEARHGRKTVTMGIIRYVISSFLFIFFTMSKAISVSTGLIFRIFFHQMEGICVNLLDPVQFFRFLKGRCHGNQFCGKIVAKLSTPALIAL